MNENIYKDIGRRTGGDIYIGVVGPVRTGKSTFVKRFMEQLVIPNIEDARQRERIIDQLPQSGDGRTITTTEPKFIPEEGARVSISKNISMKVRLVDSVGFMVPGALGNTENNKPRMVKTPWNEEEIPFDTAAEIGTIKVMKMHSTVGIVMTTDGSTLDIPREDYLKAQEKAITQMQALGKPFVVVLNTALLENPHSRKLAKDMEKEYGVPVILCNVKKMSIENIEEIFSALLREFPVTELNLDLPGYLEALPVNHKVKQEIIESVSSWMGELTNMGGALESCNKLCECPAILEAHIMERDMATGKVNVQVKMKDGLYYEIIEELMNHKVKNDKELFLLLKEYARAKEGYDQLKEALFDAESKGYGIVHPKLSQMALGRPEVFKHGSKYGVRLKATAPCLHVIKTDVTTEVSPVVGSQQQSEDLAGYLSKQFEEEDNKIWDTNLFGKTLEELICEQLNIKLTSVPEALQGKVIKSLQKISDEGKDYFICIIL